MKKLLSLTMAVLMILTCAFAFTGCSSEKGNEEKASKTNGAAAQNPVVTMDIKDYGAITIELFPDKAPNTVTNFIYLANKGFYDGLTFHRVINGFMIQGGDPNGDGTGGPGYSIKGEFANNGFTKNDINHVRGVISMGRMMSDYDSAGSQFFICQQDYLSGDGDYAAFGKVLDGMDIVDKIAAVDTDSADKPKKDVVIKSVTVDTKGELYEEPETIK